MKFKDSKAKKLWNKGLSNNTDSYGGGVYTFAESWSNLMEKEIKLGDLELSNFAKKMSHKADIEGITGFMYGAAVNILASVWIYGESLRRWHNLDTQVQNEGEIANIKGTTLNPALISMELK